MIVADSSAMVNFLVGREPDERMAELLRQLPCTRRTSMT
jgi:predicted nucleic acid-binding protein